jgi:deoxyadenosine/deoxycytidine kinase
MGMTVHVSSMAGGVSNHTLRGTFKQFGTITGTRVIYPGTVYDGVPVANGMGLLRFSVPREAASAIATMHGQMLHGQALVVKHARDLITPQDNPSKQSQPVASLPRTAPMATARHTAVLVATPATATASFLAPKPTATVPMASGLRPRPDQANEGPESQTLADIQAERALDTQRTTQRTSRAELTVSFAHTGKTAGTLCVDQCMVPEVIGKGGSNIEALSKAAGISRKPFYDRDHKAFMLNDMTTDKMEALQKEVQQFLRLRLGERIPQKKKVIVSGMKGVNNQFEHLAEEDVVKEKEQPASQACTSLGNMLVLQQRAVKHGPRDILMQWSYQLPALCTGQLVQHVEISRTAGDSSQTPLVTTLVRQWHVNDGLVANQGLHGIHFPVGPVEIEGKQQCLISLSARIKTWFVSEDDAVVSEIERVLTENQAKSSVEARARQFIRGAPARQCLHTTTGNQQWTDQRPPWRIHVGTIYRQQCQTKETTIHWQASNRAEPASCKGSVAIKDPTPQTCLYLEGTIGCGKSTFLERIGARYGQLVHVMEEPVSCWDEVRSADGVTLLENFYRDQRAHAATLQHEILRSRLAQCRRMSTDKPIILIERSIDCGREVFVPIAVANGTMQPLQKSVYDRAFDETRAVMQQHVPAVDAAHSTFIYLRVSPSEAGHRIRARGRDGEGGITPEYLQDLHDRHDNWLARGTSALPSGGAARRVVAVTADPELKTSDEVLHKVFVRILRGARAPAAVIASANRMGDPSGQPSSRVHMAATEAGVRATAVVHKHDGNPTRLPFKASAPDMIPRCKQGIGVYVKWLPRDDRNGFIIQEVSIAVVRGNHGLERRDFTEAWKVTAGKVTPSPGHDCFLVPWTYHDHPGTMTIDTRAWFVPKSKQAGNFAALGMKTSLPSDSAGGLYARDTSLPEHLRRAAHIVRRNFTATWTASAE